MDEAISLMVESHRNAIAVIENETNLKGILTDHDVIRAVHSRQSKGGSISQDHVKDWMSADVITCDVEAKYTDALKLMGKHSIRHLILTDKGLPMATVSIRDILSKIHQNDELEVSVLRDIAIASRAAFAG